MAKTIPLTPSTPKATPVSDPLESVAAIFGPEEISESEVASLQVASGIRSSGLGMTLFILEERVDLVLTQAWRAVRPTLDLRDLWTVAVVAPYVQEGYGIELGCLESLLLETEDSDVDPGDAKNLLPKVRSWDLITRWAVLRAVENSFEAAMKRSGNRKVIFNRFIEDEFRKVLTT